MATMGREDVPSGPAVPGGPVRYEFLFAERVSDAVKAGFPQLSVRGGPAGGTSMSGWVVDRSELRELLDRFDDLGLTVVEMRQVPS